MIRRALLAAPFGARFAFAQTGPGAAWPDRPVRLLVAFPAGSVTDTLIRNLSDPLARELGQPVIVENRPGANGVIGTEAGARAPADGSVFTILSVTNGAMNTFLMRRLPYDPLRDFAPVGFLAETSYILVVNAAAGIADLRGLIERARERPGQLTYSHGNSSAHIASATMCRLAGVDMVPVPYRGGPEALTDVVAGRVDSTFTDLAAGLPQVREGRLRALGVTLAQPFPLAPDVPPVGSVLPGFEFVFWFGLGAPAATPAPVVMAMNVALNRVLADPAFGERVARLGYVPRGSAPEAFRSFLREQIATLGARAREAGLEPG